MSTAISFLPALLGVVVVFQAGLNRKISAQWGLASAVFLNALVFTIIAGVVWLKQNGKDQIDLKNISWWYVIPGIFGYMLVVGGPWAISRWGAVHTFILIISAQLLTSLIWDTQIEGLSVSPLRIAGIALAWIGAVMVCKA